MLSERVSVSEMANESFKRRSRCPTAVAAQSQPPPVAVITTTTAMTATSSFPIVDSYVWNVKKNRSWSGIKSDKLVFKQRKKLARKKFKKSTAQHISIETFLENIDLNENGTYRSLKDLVWNCVFKSWILFYYWNKKCKCFFLRFLNYDIQYTDLCASIFIPSIVDSYFK